MVDKAKEIQIIRNIQRSVDKYEYISCPICGHKKTRLLYVKEYVGLSEELEGTKFYFSECQNCGLIYQNPRSVKLHVKIHPRKEFIPTVPTKSKIVHNKYVDLYMEHIMKENQKGGSILDFWCQEGLFAQLLMRRYDAYKVYGSDPRERLVEWVRKEGIEASCSFELWGGGNALGIRENGFRYPDGFFDVVMTRHSLEHMYDLNAVMSEMNRVLRDGGLLFIEVPNGDDLSRKIFGKYWSGYFERHLYIFTVKTLKLLLEKFGFGIVRGIKVPFWISTHSNFTTSLGRMLIKQFIGKSKRIQTYATKSAKYALLRECYYPPIDLLWLSSIPFSFFAYLFNRGDLILIVAKKIKDVKSL